VLLQILKILIDNNFCPKKTIEFQWYAGEEFGKLGSTDIATSYKQQQKKVAGMLNVDMTGYNPNGKDGPISIFNDIADPKLVSLLESIADTYGKVKHRQGQCGACSDHSSWARLGFPAVMLADADGRKTISKTYHSEKDTVDTIDFDHMVKFVKMGLGFAVEMNS
jgi:leucyl aminopeptidase